jgi:hypothetical protein
LLDLAIFWHHILFIKYLQQSFLIDIVELLNLLFAAEHQSADNGMTVLNAVPFSLLDSCPNLLAHIHHFAIEA